jgi:aryl carrier-like protein
VAGGVPLPVGLARLTVQASPSTAGWAHARVAATGDGAWRADVTLWDAAGPAELASARDALAGAADPAARAAVIDDLLRTQLAAVLDMDPAQLHATTPLGGLGLDSLMALELRNRIARAIDVKISPVVVLAGGSFAELVARVVEAHDTSLTTGDAPRHGEP